MSSVDKEEVNEDEEEEEEAGMLFFDLIILFFSIAFEIGMSCFSFFASAYPQDLPMVIPNINEMRQEHKTHKAVDKF
jgi:hypothetical protein